MGDGRPLRAVFALVGFTSVIAQIVLMRELMVVFSGNELSLGLMLASWLLWTAAGSALLGRLGGGARGTVAALETAVAAATPLTILAVRASKQVFQRVPGEILGPGPMLVTSLAALSVFCVLSGWLFAAASRLCAEAEGRERAEAAGSVYLWEAAGSGAGGVLAGFVLIRHFTALDIAWFLALLNLVAATSLVVRNPIRRSAMLAIFAAAFALFVFPVASRRMEKASLARLWHGFQVIATRNSEFGNLAVLEAGGSRSLFENGLATANANDRESAEESVHYALLEHPAPRSVLVIGGGASGSLTEALRHESIARLDYVELDPAVLALTRQYIPAAIPSDRRLHTHHADGRVFLRHTPNTYDVILLNLPDPQTAQINRFYTLEFFREAATKLNPGGVFSLKVRGAENYISPELGEFLRCIRKTLGEVFGDVWAMPGETIHFFAAAHSGVLVSDPNAIVSRLRSRALDTRYVREYYIPFRLMPDRVRQLDAEIAARAETPVNRDFAPIAYYFDTVLWGSQFTGPRAFEWMAHLRFGYLATALALLLAALAFAIRRRVTAIAGYAVAAMGFTLIGMEILILLAFQASHGYVYQELAMLTAALMAGMALGAWRAVRSQSGAGVLTVIQLTAVAAPLLLSAVFEFVSQATLVFVAAALLAGFLGGYQFPVAGRMFFKKSARGAGVLYGLDLAGACLGALALSVYLIPVFGFFKTALVMALVNAAPALLLASGLRRLPR